jgi:hypothetical protein
MTATTEVAAAPRWMDVRQAAAYANVGIRSIYAAVRKSELKAAIANERGDMRILREWIDEWLIRRAERGSC